jgi:uncharacterized protein (TIGR02646 family)
MRWVCKADIEGCLKEEWRIRAAAKLEELKNASTDAERKTILNRQSSSKLWRDFYMLLPENLKKKCWYCEAEDIRSDMPVDHFRPKNKVEEDDAHLGYWWLAYDWENYRCACQLCNSRRVKETTEGGKQCSFPLVNPSSRVYDDSGDINAEEPNFLDPFNWDDHKLLWFDSDGEPEPVPSANPAQQEKVKNSIKIFHLHEKRIVKRRNAIRIEISKRIKKLKASPPVREVSEIKNELRKMIRDSEQLSRAATVYLSAHRDMPEICDILQID